jgi:hypothetical protein
MIEVWEAVSGGTDGRDCYLIGRFTRREDAEKAAKGRGTMGFGDGYVYGPTTVYESFNDYLKNNPKAVKERALKKLTEEEREVLNI